MLIAASCSYFRIMCNTNLHIFFRITVQPFVNNLQGMDIHTFAACSTALKGVSITDLILEHWSKGEEGIFFSITYLSLISSVAN